MTRFSNEQMNAHRIYCQSIKIYNTHTISPSCCQGMMQQISFKNKEERIFSEYFENRGHIFVENLINFNFSNS